MRLNNNLIKIAYNKAHVLAYYLHKRQAYLALAKRMQKNIAITESLFSRDINKEYKKKWNILDPCPSSLFFKMYSSFRGEVDLRYIPDYLYSFPIDCILSNFRYATYTENKGIYESRLAEFRELFPRSIAFKINGVWYDRNYRYIADIIDFTEHIQLNEIIVKEGIDSGSGRGVHLLRRNTTGNSFVDSTGIDLIALLGRSSDYVIQERVRQCEFMRAFNESSINTFRVVSYRSVTTNDVHIMQTLLRRGTAGSLYDNLHAGGNLIEVDQDGKLADFGLDEAGRKIPNEKSAVIVPYYTDIQRIATEIATKDFCNRQLFFDFFIDDSENVRLMEINLTSFPTIQAYCGPAFGEFTDEVIDFCHANSGYLVKIIPVTMRSVGC